MKTVIKQWWSDKYALSLLLLYILSSTIYSALNSKVTILISDIIAEPNIRNNIILLIVICIMQIFLSIISAASRPLATSHMYTTAHNKFTNKIIDGDYEMFTKFSCAGIVTTSEALYDISMTGKLLSYFINALINMIVVIFSIYLIAGKLVIPVIIIYLIGGFIIKYLFKKYSIYDNRFNTIKRNRNQIFHNCIDGFTEIRSFNTGNHYKETIHNMNTESFNTIKKRTKIDMLISGSFDLIDGLGLLIVIIYSINEISKGNMTQAAAMSLVMFVFRIISPISQLLDVIDSISQSLSKIHDYEKIMKYENKISSNGNIDLTSFNDEIKLTDISFAYGDSHDTLSRINMTIKKGQKVGICGVSGAGKSTLFKLLNKFYSPTSGTITINGFNIFDITDRSYWKHVASVHQENMIFPGSIRENITYGTFNATEYEIIEAAKKANLYDFIMNLDDKFETEVGPRGLKLSGGQKQRIALARMFIKNPDIVLLDEATSALDNESEALIQDSLKNLREDQTVITIAHRLTTIKDCDIIYVIGDGGILEYGTHDELMNKLGAYYKMYTASNK